MSSSTKARLDPIRLWIGQDWYIPVDQIGRCVGETAEGALGFVIKVYSARQVGSFRALKIPRLLGDTHRENAYTCQLMEQEIATAMVIAGVPSKAGFGRLLLPLPIGGAGGSILRGSISTDFGLEDAGKWDGAVLLVRFEKDYKPQFCLIKPDKDGKDIVSLPEALKKDPTFPKLDVTEYESIRRSALPQDVRFYEIDASSNKPRHYTIDDAINREATGATWYAALPSIVYPWAPGTLQEAISRGSLGLRGEWGINQHLALVESICLSLRALHERKLLHCDIRPANIVFIGSAIEPDQYYLADYGSFSADQLTLDEVLPHQQRNTSGAQPAGQLESIGATRLPVVVGERASAFYAPERRLGREREAADTAIIFSETNYLEIVLGWKRDFYNDQGQPDVAKIKGDYLAQAQTADPDQSFPDSVLLEGDRVQIREFIFELAEAERRFEDKQILRCRKQYWEIHHGKIAVASLTPLPAVKDLPVPRTVELLKWSVATDIYSLGILLIYSIFRNDDEAENDGSRLEDEFREMLIQLNNRQYFDAIWLEMDWLRYCMEEALESGEYNADEFANIEFFNYNRQQRNDTDPRTLIEAAIVFTNRITQTAPGVHRIVVSLNHNVAFFVFIMHFTMCCIHRQVHLRKDTIGQTGWDQNWKQQLPFCANRHDLPDKSNAAPNALARLVKLRAILGKNELSKMIPETPKEIRGYDPRSDYAVRVALDTLREVVNGIKDMSGNRRWWVSKEAVLGWINSIPSEYINPEQGST